MATFSRREFLLAGAGAAGAVVLAACGSGSSDDAAVKVTNPDDSAVNKPGSRLNLVVASYVHTSGPEQRLTLALLNDDASGPLLPDGPVSFSIDGTDVEAELYADGSIPLPYYLVRHRFEQPGVVTVKAVTGAKNGEAAVEVLDPAGVKIPIPGTALISTPTPTVADARGVDPICTAEPACPLHEISIDAALAEKRPLAVLFATPARCMSRLCGPVLDNLLAYREAFADRVRFVHVEIYATRTGQGFAPAVSAYHLDSEPFLFLAGADGMVRERLDNAFDRTEVGAALGRLVA
ncbi:MAG: hypothetical protein ABIW46_04845 [Acidimicrobiales bacterium]